MVRIGIYGVCGKMGMRLADLAIKEQDIELVSAVENDGHPAIGKDVGAILGHGELGIKILSGREQCGPDIDCAIDFTSAKAALEHVRTCVDNGIPIVIGTTGFDTDGEKAVTQASERIPVVFSPNMATGVNLLFDLVGTAARVLGPEFSIKVDETHHVHKKDSPSGTARMIARIVKDACGKDAGIRSVRKGEVIGEHGIVFDGEYEVLEIRHKARSRDVFASGALKAARFAAGRKPGLYSMADVLGLV